ncbi:65-kDa microtubule-associated protein 7-like [Curcuma longa]|uniref:65-kDa microtubule-associated protein 7-like n=1 Tax=Curcuma longa TaxID=136217 RepID=UPI003D9F21D7
MARAITDHHSLEQIAHSGRSAADKWEEASCRSKSLTVLPTNISDATLDGLAQVVLKLTTEKKMRTQKLKDACITLLELWNHLMDSSEEERWHFEEVTDLLETPEIEDNFGILVFSQMKQSIRKEIINRVNKWLSACEEEGWLEEYDNDTSKYTPGRGTHLNLKQAENARLTVSKIPAIINNLMNKIFVVYPVTSAGDATPGLLAPHSYSGRYNCCFKETRRSSTAPLNFVAMPEDASVQGSAAGSLQSN